MNEHYDLAAEVAFDLGFDALHVRAPDELLMAAEEEALSGGSTNEADARCRCVLTILRVLTYNVKSLDDITRRVATLCVEMLPWQRDRVPRHFVSLAEGRRRQQSSTHEVTRQMIAEWHAETALLLLGMLTSGFDEWRPREVGKRVLITLYAAQADQRLRPPMARNLSAIGAALGLTAKNKRSAVSAAIKAHVLPMFQRMAAASTGQAPEQTACKLWFMKSQHCRAALRVAMRGKRNRAARE